MRVVQGIEQISLHVSCWKIPSLLSFPPYRISTSPFPCLANFLSWLHRLIFGFGMTSAEPYENCEG